MTRHITARHLLDYALKNSLLAFIIKSFHEINQDGGFLNNWHLRAIEFQLMQTIEGNSRRLIITQPPRSLKSISVSVAYVAWRLGHNPALKIICVSYSSELAAELARQFRSVVTSSWYRALFPKMRLAKDTAMEAVTTMGGGRYATSVGGTVTGRGAQVIIVDDPMKAEDALSAVERKKVISWYGNTLISRLNKQGEGTIILAMQRLHEEDLAGHLLEQTKVGWVHLDLPAIAQVSQKVAIGNGKYYQWAEGEPLHPELLSLKTLEQLNNVSGSQVFSAVYLQRPVPFDGNMIKREWLTSYTGDIEVEEDDRIVHSWDTAQKIGDNNDYSVCTCWVIKGQKYYLYDVIRERLEYTQLRKRVIALAERDGASYVLIEDKGSGTSLIQELKNEIRGIYPIAIEPHGDKITRMGTSTPFLERGQVHIKEDGPWFAAFLNEILAFPHSRHDDQVDSMSQFLNYAEDRYRNRPATNIKVVWG